MREKKSFSKKLQQHIDHPRYVGFFSAQDALSRNMRLVTKKEGSMEKGYLFCLYWLVDETDGVICDAAFQAFAPPELVGACDVLSELVLRKNYDQVSRIGAELIDQHVRDRREQPAFDQFAPLNLLLSAVDQAVQQCMDIPFAATYEKTPLLADANSSGPVEGWEELSNKKKIELIEEIIDKEIRPYIELDAGGVEVIGLKNNKEVLIAYQGACTSCYSATGSTLSAIQQILQQRIHPDLFVTPQI